MMRTAQRSAERLGDMKLACADYAFPLLAHDKVLDLIAALEFEGVDIGLFEGRSHLWPSKVLKSPLHAGKQLNRGLAQRGLRCADVFLQTDTSFITYAVNHPGAPRRRRARDWFIRALDYAAASGAKHLTALPGVVFEGEARADSWDRCCDELAWRVEHAHRHQLVFGIEAHTGSIVAKPRQALRLMQSVPGLTLSLDVAHFARAGLQEGEVEPLVPYASHFHARAARKGRLQTSFKLNTIDYAAWVRALRQAHYHGYLVVEYVWVDWQHCNEVDNLSETILLRDFLRAQMA